MSLQMFVLIAIVAGFVLIGNAKSFNVNEGWWAFYHFSGVIVGISIYVILLVYLMQKITGIIGACGI